MIRLGYVPSILLVVSKINTTNNNNNLFCLTKKTNNPFCASKKEILFFHLTKNNNLFCSTKNIDSCQINLEKKIFLKMKKSWFDISTKEEHLFCQ